MKAIFRALVLVLSAIAIPGCGGGGGGGSSSGSGGSGSGVTPAPVQLPIQTAKLIDAPVAGVGYNCPAVGTNTTTQTGTTDAQGQFSYQAGQSCTLKVGVITLGTLASIPADGIATPQDIAGVSRTAAQAPGAVAIAQFLQSLNDGSVGGAINIPSSVTTALSGASVPATTLVSSAGVADQTTLTAIVATAGKQLVTPDAAKSALVSGQAAAGVDNTRGSVSPTAPVALSSLSASGALTKIGVGASLQLKVTGYYTDGTTKDITSQASYSSSNVAVATVTSAGLVSAATAGSVVITANVSNSSSTVNLTVVPVYSVTATVSGLAGAGLVLQNNGANDISPSANGAISFSATALTGSAYAITVKTQPSSPSQTCVVGNGSGTVATANVSNINVTCTTNTYAITATVSGLAGAGLILQNNGANDLSFSSNGTFTINPAALSGSAYAVTVKAQPSSPSQTCVVGNGSGTVVSANVSNITINCTTNIYAITATVSGLAGTGLILQNNGANDLSFTSNGTFTINSAALSGSAYAVTVKTQPSSPSQTCVVGNGSGLVTNAGINVVVSCTTNTYAITATVSGLAGTGLILQNNGANDLSFSTNGTFTINSAALSGSSYAVTVKTQPSSPSQTCVVGGGSGTVGSANVSNITVACTTNTYAITATVSGLAGTGLILQNNGANDLSFSTNGTFTINSAALSGSAYAMTVKTQPSAPSQSCVVAGGSGTVGGAIVSSITVTCTTNTYAITATVSGLAGTGFVLQNNGANDLSFTSNGTFSINSSVLSGSAYNVTVKTQPTSPIQTCVIGNGSGTVTNAGVNVTVSCTTAPPTVQSSTYSLNVLGIAPSSGSATVTASDQSKLALTYSISQQPSEGSVTINSATGSFVYKIDGHPSSPMVQKTSFIVKAANSYAFGLGTITINLNSDPLLPNQWHLQNTGQDAFATNRPVAGNDMNLAGAWLAGYSGKGVKVGVVDTGLEAAHEDLAANVDLTHSRNFLTGGNDPTPSAVGIDHGTMVAGIIGAVAFNGKGGRGVAYSATLRGYNLLANSSVANMAASLGSSTASADNDLFNLSFEQSQPALPPFSGVYQSITNAALGLRGGFGASFVNAAGNDFKSIQNGSASNCTNYANLYGVSCGDTAGDERRGGYYPLIVAALSANGKHAPYSTTGSSVWISAPAGDYGLNSAYWTGASDYDPAIVTTSRTGCANAENYANPLDSKGASSLAADCQYTAMMNGTSAATPNVAGVVALMLEANKNLSWRDIKYILAKTAKPVDATFGGVTSSTILPGSTVTLEQGWITNAAGYNFSNRYGFGALDAAAAVAMAKTYTSYLPALVDSSNYTFLPSTPALIPSASATGSRVTWNVTESFKSVEFVVLFVNIASTPGIQCNQIELTSPSGTKSILLHAATGYTNTAIANTRFESNAFYGEAPNGTWSLRFIDLCPLSATRTTLSSASPQLLSFAGH